jgi:hypothetical protein
MQLILYTHSNHFTLLAPKLDDVIPYLTGATAKAFHNAGYYYNTLVLLILYILV